MIQEDGFLAHDGTFCLTVEELAEYNRQTVDDWTEWRVDEVAKEIGLDYARLDRL